MFFVATGVALNMAALFHSARAEILVPIILVALLLVRGVPAVLYGPALGWPAALAAGLLQATSLTFIVVTTIVGLDTGHLRPSTASALVVAGLLSVILYPPTALQLLKPRAEEPQPDGGRLQPESSPGDR